MRPFSYHDTTDTREASEGHRSVGTGTNETGSRGLVDRPRSASGHENRQPSFLGEIVFPPFTIGLGSWSNGPLLSFSLDGIQVSIIHPVCLFTSLWLSLPLLFRI